MMDRVGLSLSFYVNNKKMSGVIWFFQNVVFNADDIE